MHPTYILKHISRGGIDMPIKRYLVFGGKDFHYARGGFTDLIGNVDSVEEADSLLENIRVSSETESEFPMPDPDKLGWYQIVDIETGEILKEDCPYYDPGEATYSCKFEKGEIVYTHYSRTMNSE